VRYQHFTDSRAGEVNGESCRVSRYAKSICTPLAWPLVTASGHIDEG
jgi:hypothetical protein